VVAGVPSSDGNRDDGNRECSGLGAGEEGACKDGDEGVSFQDWLSWLLPTMIAACSPRTNALRRTRRERRKGGSRRRRVKKEHWKW
jgi:hypothetical protein